MLHIQGNLSTCWKPARAFSPTALQTDLCNGFLTRALFCLSWHWLSPCVSAVEARDPLLEFFTLNAPEICSGEEKLARVNHHFLPGRLRIWGSLNLSRYTLRTLLLLCGSSSALSTPLCADSLSTLCDEGNVKYTVLDRAPVSSFTFAVLSIPNAGQCRLSASSPAKCLVNRRWSGKASHCRKW